MKHLFIWFLILGSFQTMAQCEKVFNENPSDLINVIDNSQDFEAFDELFLFKNSDDYFVLSCKKECAKCTCVEKKYRHLSFSGNKCSFDLTTEKLKQKKVYADFR